MHTHVKAFCAYPVYTSSSTPCSCLLSFFLLTTWERYAPHLSSPRSTGILPPSSSLSLFVWVCVHSLLDCSHPICKFFKIFQNMVQSLYLRESVTVLFATHCKTISSLNISLYVQPCTLITEKKLQASQLWGKEGDCRDRDAGQGWGKVRWGNNENVIFWVSVELLA